VALPWPAAMTLTRSQLLPSPAILWQTSLKEVLAGRQGQGLSGPWRLLLLGDGSPTRHLEVLSGDPVRIELIAMAPEDPWDAISAAAAPPERSELPGPLLRRQVWLCCGSTTLAWAESWWNRDQADHHLRQREQPIWSSLTSDRAELFREVDGLALVRAPWLEERLGAHGPLWSRHYRFFRAGRPLTVIREVFSPRLEQWLGSAGQLPTELMRAC
jgi:chorismate--pyruvate lyase